MRTPSLTSEQKPSKGQVRQVQTLTAAAVEKTLDEKGGFTADQLQAIHANGGWFKKEFAVAYRAFVLDFARKALAMITPIRAQDTGFVPAGWGVQSDDLEGGINLANLDYSSCPVRDGETYVNGDNMPKRLAGAYGSLGFAAALLKLQDEGKEIFPVESRDKHHFVMPRTILLDSFRNRRVTYFRWQGKYWMLFIGWVDDCFSSNCRFIRPRQR